ncbi:MAG: glucosamine-6-phosphate deaminase [Bacteroidales bacterium]|jgi:glucosamine-6-phosphate deaminase|nr:glucosamine-6-phosphate deaminase [Bacteroidales bacterium]
MKVYQYRQKMEMAMKESDSSYETAHRYEKIPTEVYANADDATVEVAQDIVEAIKKKALRGEPFVLGLATGSTTSLLYTELVRLHKEENVSFGNVHTFNIDEYYPIQPDALQSHYYYMRKHLFEHLDIPKENINFPDGTLPQEQVTGFCAAFDRKITALGGIDWLILGIGRTGHIGFNEPGSMVNSPTRLISLDTITRVDAAADFFSEEFVPRRAITMGLGTILAAKKIVLLAWGEGKSHIIRDAVEGPVTDSVPTSYLQHHANTKVVVDLAAASELTRIKTPWLVGVCNWNDRLIRKATVWLCQKTDKPILKLTDRDYNDNGMSDLTARFGPASTINIQVFNDLQHTISGWPGGKPNADDSTRPERALPYPKRVVIFSPHPDDDVISMGGTFARLVQQQHDVHVAYQTSGNIAIFDDDVIRFLDFGNQFSKIFELGGIDTQNLYKKLAKALDNKKPGEPDIPEVRQLKSAIRRSEAMAAVRYIGVPEDHVHFLNLPFYETGTVQKSELSETDIKIIINLLQKVKPHQIYAAGDLSDPHGTHRVCINAILAALHELWNEEWLKDCRLWMYRGAWQEWDLDQVDMAVPLSPEEVLIKRKTIYKHTSQNNGPVFPGSDSREFWQRAEERNHATAVLYDKLGMAEYQAIEVFVKFDLNQIK